MNNARKTIRDSSLKLNTLILLPFHTEVSF